MTVVATYDSDRWFIDDLCSRLPGRKMSVDTPYSNKAAKEKPLTRAQNTNPRGKKRPRMEDPAKLEAKLEKKKARIAKRKERRKLQKEMWKQRRAEAELRKSDPARMALKEKLVAKIKELKAQRAPKIDSAEALQRYTAKRRKKRKLEEKRQEAIKRKKKLAKKAYRDRKKEEKRANREKEEFKKKPEVPKEESRKRPREEEPDTALEFSLETKVKKKSRNAKVLLKALENKEKLLETLPKEQAENIKDEARFKSALIRAAGGVVRDDKQLLKKAVRKRAKAKARSQKEWRRRERNVLRIKQESQAIRKKNILEKIKAKKEKILNKRMPNERVP